MKYLYFDASSGASGDMILAALLDLGFSRAEFKKQMDALRLPLDVRIEDAMRGGLRGLRVEIRIKKGKESKPRRFADVEKFIRGAPFSDSVKANGLAIFRTLFEAESRVHGVKFADTHLHEAGADDALADVLGSAYLAEKLEVGPVYGSPLNVGQGWVKTSHGVLPVPPPAVAEILKNTPVYSAWAKEELVTPTGAAILKTWADAFLPWPELSYERIGYGAGHRDFTTHPNILRVFYGDEASFEPRKRVYQVEADIDDSSPQLLAHFAEQARTLGALDVSLSPVVMKKGRLGTKLTILADAATIDELVESVWRETSSIGVRYFPVERRVLRRDVRVVKVLGEDVGVKVATLAGEAMNVQPEFSDCLRVAARTGLPAKRVQELALRAYAELERKRKAKK